MRVTFWKQYRPESLPTNNQMLTTLKVHNIFRRALYPTDVTWPACSVGWRRSSVAARRPAFRECRQRTPAPPAWCGRHNGPTGGGGEQEEGHTSGDPNRLTSGWVKASLWPAGQMEIPAGCFPSQDGKGTENEVTDKSRGQISKKKQKAMNVRTGTALPCHPTSFF